MRVGYELRQKGRLTCSRSKGIGDERMRISSALQGLRLIGQAEGDRRTYYVYQGDGPFIVASPNDRGGLNVNVVESEAPDVVGRRFKGQRVTGSTLMNEGRRTDLFKASFT